MRRVLQTLPKDLNETYDRILQNIPQTRIHNAIKLLQLLIHSKRPMLLGEVVDAVATNPDDEWPFTFENRIDPLDAIMGYCPSFLRITTTYVEKGYLGDSGQDEEDERLADSDIEVRLTIQIAHFSVQEYLLLDRKENPYRGSFEKQSANATITQLCLAYLWTVPVEEAEEASEIGHSIPRFPFFEYATIYWPGHAMIAGESEESTFKWICEFFTNDRAIQHWKRPSLPRQIDCQLSTWALYHASLYGLVRSVEHLLEAGADANDYIVGHGTALQSACRSGSIESVRLMVNHGTDLDPIDRRRNALHDAASHGHAEILLLMLENGAQVNATDGRSETALQKASAQGHTEAVQVLLEYGAQVNATGDYSGTALQEACARGHVEVVQLLLERHAQVNATGEFGTALVLALETSDRSSSQFYELRIAKIVGMLLDHGADVNISGNGCPPALLTACAGKRIDRGIVQLLLDHSADPNLVWGYYGTALCAAAYHGHVEVMQVLLDNGADPNVVGGDCGSALCAASSNGDPAVVEMLLQAGADVNALVGEYGTALCAAAYHGHVGVMQLLLDNGADLNAQEDYYGEVLSAATQCGYSEVVKMLLQRGANADFADRKYGEALNIAAQHGHVETLRLLLDNGVDPNAFMGRCGFALCAASRHDSIEMVEALLRKGADINATGGKYDCALRAAAWYGHVEVLRVLLDNGAVSDTQGRPYRRALQDAIEEGHQEIARIVFGEGAQKQLAITQASCDLRLKVRYDHNR
jgi:ankyrin repeat protein